MRDALAARGASDTPLYLQLARSLREHIADGGVAAGGALPSERDLVEMSGMSRVTVRKAIEALIQEGILYRKQGSGTFVARRIDHAGAALVSFTAEACARGEQPSVIWIMRRRGAATYAEAMELHVPEDTPVARLSRVRLTNDEPLAIEHAVVPAALLPDLDTLGDSLYAALALAGTRPVSGTQRIRAGLATPTEAGILSIAENAAILRIERVAFDAQGRGVEFTRSAYRGDRFDFVTDLSRSSVQAKPVLPFEV